MGDCSYIEVLVPHKLVKDLSGRKFSRLTVKRLLGKNLRSKCMVWRCTCDCGSTVDCLSVNLLSGNTQSCGCLRAEKLSVNRKGKPPARTLPEGEAALNFLYNTYKREAGRFHREFSLTRGAFKCIVTSNCHYCGISPQKEIRNAHNNLNGTFRANGVDRVDSLRGYSLDNVVPCCTRCNLGKRELRVDDFLSWVKKVYEFNKLETPRK